MPILNSSDDEHMQEKERVIKPKLTGDQDEDELLP
jgi:hypothetical protein